MFGKKDETSAIDVDGIKSKVGIKGRTQDVTACYSYHRCTR